MRPADDVRRLLALYASMARPVLRDYWTRNSCIASTAVTIKVLRALGIQATPFPCRVAVFSAAMCEKMNGRRDVPDEAELRSWFDGEDRDPRVWSIGIGFETPGTPPDLAHLVAIVESRFMVDASLDQANRPERGIELPPVLVSEITREFRRAKKTRLALMNYAGTQLVYEPAPKKKGYLTSPDWHEEHRHTQAVHRLVAKMLRKIEYVQ